MSEPIILASFSLDVDLRIITSHLWANGIAHRVVEQNQQQVLILADAKDAPKAHKWLEQWQAGQLEMANPDDVLSNSRGSTFEAALKSPATLMGAAVFIIVFSFQQISTSWHTWLPLGELFWPSLRNNPQVLLELGFWPVWRLSLLHFSFMHLLFNLVWWWVIGHRIEQKDGRFTLLLLVVIAGYVGNLAQWWLTGPAFGGASGITMALLGWVGWRQLQKKNDYQLPPLLLPLMVGWIVVIIFAENLLGMNSQTGHGGHIAGLVSGLLLAILIPKKPIASKEK